MSLNHLKADVQLEEEKDVLGGGSRILDTDVYDFKIKLAYMGQSKGGANNVNFVFETADSRELKQTIYVTSGQAKGCKTYYTKNGKNFPLPGFSQVNAICLLTVGKEIGDLDTEEKVINLWDFDAAAEVPTKVPMLMDLLNQDITLAVFKQIVDKNVDDGAGNWVPSGETREENEVDRVFRTRDGLTVNEIKANETEPKFKAAWVEKWQGEVKNKAKGAKAGGGSTAGAPAAKEPTKKLFG